MKPLRWPTLQPTLRPNMWRASPLDSRGSATLPVLVATLLMGLGSSAVLRWSAALVAHDADQQLRRQALVLMHDALETGSDPSATKPGTPTPGRQHTQTDGTPLQVELRDRPAASDGGPAHGSYRTISATWTNRQGQRQHLNLHTYWYPSPRIY